MSYKRPVSQHLIHHLEIVEKIYNDDGINSINSFYDRLWLQTDEEYRYYIQELRQMIKSFTTSEMLDTTDGNRRVSRKFFWQKEKNV